MSKRIFSLSVNVQRGIIEWFHANRAYSAFRVYVGIRKYCSGHLPATTVDNYKLDFLLKKLNLSLSAYRKQVSYLKEIGFLERGKRDYHIVGQRRFEYAQKGAAFRRGRINCPNEALVSLRAFTAWVYAAQISEDIKYVNKVKGKDQKCPEMAKSSWTGRLMQLTGCSMYKAQSYIFGRYSASFFETFLDRDRSTISKWINIASDYGFLEVKRNRELFTFKQKKEAYEFREKMFSLGLIGANAPIYYQNIDNENWYYYMNIDFPNSVTPKLRVRRPMGKTRKLSIPYFISLKGKPRKSLNKSSTINSIIYTI